MTINIGEFGADDLKKACPWMFGVEGAREDEVYLTNIPAGELWVAASYQEVGVRIKVDQDPIELLGGFIQRVFVDLSDIVEQIEFVRRTNGIELDKITSYFTKIGMKQDGVFVAKRLVPVFHPTLTS